MTTFSVISLIRVWRDPNVSSFIRTSITIYKEVDFNKSKTYAHRVSKKHTIHTMFVRCSDFICID